MFANVPRCSTPVHVTAEGCIPRQPCCPGSARLLRSGAEGFGSLLRPGGEICTVRQLHTTHIKEPRHAAWQLEPKELIQTWLVHEVTQESLQSFWQGWPFVPRGRSNGAGNVLRGTSLWEECWALGQTEMRLAGTVGQARRQIEGCRLRSDSSDRNAQLGARSLAQLYETALPHSLRPKSRAANPSSSQSAPNQAQVCAYDLFAGALVFVRLAGDPVALTQPSPADSRHFPRQDLQSLRHRT